MQAGTRVMAVQSAKGNTVKSYGEGVYEGEKVPPSGMPGIGEFMHESGVRNPCILLDSGERVYGFECWWGTVEAMKKRFEGLKFETVSIQADRDELASELEKRNEESSQESG